MRHERPRTDIRSCRGLGASFGDLLRRGLYVRTVERSRRGRFDGA
jgi:hypothetical protein